MVFGDGWRHGIVAKMNNREPFFTKPKKNRKVQPFFGL